MRLGGIVGSGVIGFLLWLCGLWCAEVFELELTATAVGGLDHQPPLLAVHGQALRADLACEVDGVAFPWVDREQQLAVGEALFDRLAHDVLGVEEAVRGHQAIDALVRAKVIGVREVVRESLARFLEGVWARALPEFVEDGLPQALALAERLRAVRARHDVLDAFAPQQLLKAALAAPGEVLASLIRQDLARFAEARDALHQAIDHEVCALMRIEAPGHDVATVGVEKDRQVNAAPWACEHVARDVRLPEFPWSCALEASGQLAARLAAFLWSRAGLDSRLEQHVADAARGALVAIEAQQKITAAPHTPAGVLGLGAHHLLAAVFGNRAGDGVGGARLAWCGLETAWAGLPILARPLVEACGRNAPERCEFGSRAARPLEGFDGGAALFGREAPSVLGVVVAILCAVQAPPPCE